jgi:Ca-activated chloride channel family protein
MKLYRFIFFILLTSSLFCLSQNYERSSVDYSTPAKYNPNAVTRILFIFDDSFSMFGPWNSGNKIDVSKKMMGEFLDSIKDVNKLQIALRCYGHQTPFKPQRNCQDSKLEVPFDVAAMNAVKIKNRINQLTPTGTTPIAYSLEQCANDFPPCDNCRNVVVLITDGIEECQGDPCAVSLALQKKGIFLRPFVIGVGLDVKFADVFGCMGKFYDVSNESNFKNVMKLVFVEAVSQTTVQVNLNDIFGKPTETNVNMTFYDQNTGKIRYNYLHTLNHRGNPDTIILDPDLTYKIKVHTLPEVFIDNVTIQKGKHNIIKINSPQGKINLQVDGINLFKNLNAIIRKDNSMQTLNVQDFGKSENYLVGKYDIEVLTLPRIIINGAEVKQSHTNTIKIPAAGILTLHKGGYGSGSIYVEEGKKITWVYNLLENQQSENIYLQPGNYRVEFRLKQHTEAENTMEKKFIITSGKGTTVKIF